MKIKKISWIISLTILVLFLATMVTLNLSKDSYGEGFDEAILRVRNWCDSYGFLQNFTINLNDNSSYSIYPKENNSCLIEVKYNRTFEEEK